MRGSRLMAVALCMLPACALAQDAGGRLAQLSRGYFDDTLRVHPVLATYLGRHEGDARIDDVSAAAHKAEAARLHAALAGLQAIDPAGLAPMARDDRDVLMAELGGLLLEEEGVQQWRHNPDTYVGLATNSVYTLIERNFAAPAVRMRDAIARERQIGAVLAQARANLADMPAVYVQIARENAQGAEEFLGHDVQQAFAGVGDAGLRRELADSSADAVAQMKAFAQWLERQEKGAHGSFAYGPAHFAALLAADMISLSPEQVLAAGQAQLTLDQQRFDMASRRVDAAEPDKALAKMEDDHPDAAQLIATASAQLKGVQDFVHSHHIVTLPNDSLPVVAETPLFQRAEIFGAMDAPGVLETHADTAYYYITPPDAHESAEKQAAYMRFFNRALLLNLTVHEVMPGHFVQFLYQRAHRDWSMIRATASSYTATEGWAHYTEQMMADEGLAGQDPKLLLAQTQDALLRDCRLIVSVKMHTMGMSLADAAALMKSACRQPDSVAYKEARRGTADPGYFSYTLGKLMILKLRQDEQTRLGAKFSLQTFHDRLLSAGLVPLRIIRRELTGADGNLL